MFADRAKIIIKSGKGGDGHVSFRREKYVPDGGPDGGDGGLGGSVIFEVDEGLNTLIDLKLKKHINGTKGANGEGKAKNGKNAEDIIIKVPLGTVVTDNLGGYTWYKNSRLNRVTSWANNPSFDAPSEIIYLKDEENGRIWTPTAMPMPDDKNYNVIYFPITLF